MFRSALLLSATPVVAATLVTATAGLADASATASARAGDPVTKTFTATDSPFLEEQTFDVPADATQITITLVGAGSGGGGGGIPKPGDNTAGAGGGGGGGGDVAVCTGKAPAGKQLKFKVPRGTSGGTAAGSKVAGTADKTMWHGQTGSPAKHMTSVTVSGGGGMLASGQHGGGGVTRGKGPGAGSSRGIPVSNVKSAVCLPKDPDRQQQFFPGNNGQGGSAPTGEQGGKGGTGGAPAGDVPPSCPADTGQGGNGGNGSKSGENPAAEPGQGGGPGCAVVTTQ